MIYVLDTNVISDLITGQEAVSQHFSQAILAGHTLYLCQPVLYEVSRGLFWRQSASKLRILEQKIRPRLFIPSLIEADWLQAAQFWADAVSQGKQLSDVDLLLAAVTERLEATLVSSDADFDALPIQRVNWREAQPS